MKGINRVAPLCVALLFVSAPCSWANIMAQATARVVLFVEPTITISAAQPSVRLGSVQTGVISGQIPFQVESNGQLVSFRAVTTPLFKGGIAGNSSESIPPIPLRRDSGVRIEAEHGGPTRGEDAILHYLGAEGDIEGSPGLTTQSVEFESSQNNHFSQEVTLQVTWAQNDPEKPTGEYSGLVVLWAMVPPTGVASSVLASAR